MWPLGGLGTISDREQRRLPGLPGPPRRRRVGRPGASLDQSPGDPAIMAVPCRSGSGACGGPPRRRVELNRNPPLERRDARLRGLNAALIVWGRSATRGRSPSPRAQPSTSRARDCPRSPRRRTFDHQRPVSTGCGGGLHTSDPSPGAPYGIPPRAPRSADLPPPPTAWRPPSPSPCRRAPRAALPSSRPPSSPQNPNIPTSGSRA
jgi:hypothetical protein